MHFASAVGVVAAAARCAAVVGAAGVAATPGAGAAAAFAAAAARGMRRRRRTGARLRGHGSALAAQSQRSAAGVDLRATQGDRAGAWRAVS